MSKSRDRMIEALCETVFPVLRQTGFRGSFPHFRRVREEQIDLVTFQFNRWGGSFVVEIAFCPSVGITTFYGKQLPPAQVRAHDIHPAQRLRLGSHPPEETDHWFHYEPERPDVYTDAARMVLLWLHGQAEEFWRTHQPAKVRPGW